MAALRFRSFLAALAATSIFAGCTVRHQAESATTVRVSRSSFGQLPDGRTVDLYTLTNTHGVEVRVMTYGAIITVVRTPDRAGHVDDIALGFDSLAGYLGEHPYFGAVVGRYANRIAHGQFSLDGVTYHLALNNGPNALHGGRRGFDKVLWSAEQFSGAASAGVALRHESPDGDENYPGALTARVTFVNLTQHSYWNLRGEGRGDILGHVVEIDASSFTPVDSTLIPTGEIAPVTGTPFDFRVPTPVGARIAAPNEQIRFGGGYDHNWVLNRKHGGLTHAARVVDPASGRSLDVSTTEPGMQFYTGNFLDGTIVGKVRHVYVHRGALVLETQHFPDSPNHPNFPSTVLRPGATYRSRTVFAFGVVR
jgi:aldose 1-epimerase